MPVMPWLGAALAQLMLLVVASASAGAAWELPQAGAQALPAACPDTGARVVSKYPVCEDQQRVLGSAVASAKAAGKLLIIEFGATWCPQCAALDRTLPGPEVMGFQGGRVDLAKTFDVVKIGTSTLANGKLTPVPQGEAILAHVLAKAKDAEWHGWPFLAVIDPGNDAIAFTRNTNDLMRDAGSHDPAMLREALVNAHDFLRLGKAPPPEPRPGLLSRVYHWIFG